MFDLKIKMDISRYLWYFSFLKEKNKKKKLGHFLFVNRFTNFLLQNPSLIATQHADKFRLVKPQD